MTVFKIIVIFLLITIVFLFDYLVKKGKIECNKDTYSYKIVLRESIWWLLIVLTICTSIYLYSKSFEVTLNLGIFLLAIIIAGTLRALFLQYQFKRRGGRKIG